MTHPLGESKIKRIDIEPYLKEAARRNTLSGGTKGAFFMEVIRQKMITKIQAGEHIHLYAKGIEECIYPNEQCWEGPRNIA